MGATVRVNGHILGVVTDQFLRYSFTLDPAEVNLVRGSGANRLDVTFGLDDVAEDGRFMACTGGWDWAPYSYTTSNSSANTTGPANTLSKGLWKSVYLIEVPRGSVAITHVTPHTAYQGAYPTSRLTDGEHGGFVVNVTIHVWVPMGAAVGSLTVTGEWDNESAVASSGKIVLSEGTNTVSLKLTATAKQIQLWWPRGVGAQPLYNVTVKWTQQADEKKLGSTTSTIVTSRRMGFRVFALVTVNDTDATVVATHASAQVNDTGTHGMFFRINGAPIYSRGANMIPMEELEGRLDADAHRILVKSAADAGMNTLRVWGGGIFYPSAFYDACDKYGVLLYHDMQYASTGGGTHGPLATSTQEAELRHQIRRLSHHPSIVLWDGNNEVPVNMWQPSSLFATFVMTIVAEEDQSRAIWPSSPAVGWSTGVDRLYQTPHRDSPSGLTTKGGGHSWTGGIETHAPYQTGGGWPTVNGGISDSCFVQNGMGNGVNLPNIFIPPHGIEPPPPPQHLKCYAVAKAVCAANMHNLSDCENCRFTVPGAWEKLKPACSPYPIANFHESCKSFFPTPPLVAHTGIGQPNVYASEFGTTGSSSFESMSATLSPQHWGLHGGMPPDSCDEDQPGNTRCVGQHQCTGKNPMTQRNYGCDGAIILFFGNDTKVNLNETGEAAFKGQLYLCQLAQAVVLKQIFEARREQNAFGHLVWMLNEIWPTVGWGSLEYGPRPGFTPGQVRGGRWKPLHYFYKSSLMVDVMSTCGNRAGVQNGSSVCYISNHRAGMGFEGTVTLTSYDHFGDGAGVVVAHKEFVLPAGPGVIQWFTAELPTGNTSSIISTVRNNNGAVLSEHMVQLVKPLALRVPVTKLSFKISDAANSDGTIDIMVSSDKVALWVTLTSLAQGRFSENAFFLPATTRTIQFIPFSPSTAAYDHKTLQASLRIEDFSMYA